VQGLVARLANHRAFAILKSEQAPAAWPVRQARRP
jgi:hypothetical protein